MVIKLDCCFSIHTSNNENENKSPYVFSVMARVILNCVTQRNVPH